MGLDTSWTDSNAVTAVTKPVTDVAKSGIEAYAKKKISDNELVAKLDSNRLDAYKTTSKNNLDAFLGVLNTGAALVNAVTSVINTAINAYAQIQESREQTRRVEIQAEAQIFESREQTKRIRITQEQETVRHLATLKADLEVKRMELDKFKLELAEQRATREFKQEQWRSQIAMLEKIINPVIDAAKDVRKRCFDAQFTNEHDYAELKRLDETLFAYAMQLKELYS